MKDYQQQLAYNIRKKASLETFAKIAKVTAVYPGGRYDIELAGGQTLNKVNSLVNNKWNEDDWVTIEWLGGDCSISGSGARRGGG